MAFRKKVVKKGKAARKFSKDVRSVAALNVRAAPLRGGWRL